MAGKGRRKPLHDKSKSRKDSRIKELDLLKMPPPNPIKAQKPGRGGVPRKKAPAFSYARGTTAAKTLEFFTGIYETALSSQELLVAVELPVAKKNATHFFHEFARRHGDYAIVGLAAQASVKDGIFAALRLGFFAVGDRPVLAKTAAKLM